MSSTAKQLPQKLAELFETWHRSDFLPGSPEMMPASVIETAKEVLLNPHLLGSCLSSGLAARAS